MPYVYLLHTVLRLAWDLVIEHPSGTALHPVLEGGVHVADAAPVDVVRLQTQVPRALGRHVAPLRGCQEAVKADRAAKRNDENMYRSTWIVFSRRRLFTAGLVGMPRRDAKRRDAKKPLKLL